MNWGSQESTTRYQDFPQYSVLIGKTNYVGAVIFIFDLIKSSNLCNASQEN